MLISSFLLLMIFPMIIVMFLAYNEENRIFQEQVSGYLEQTLQQTHRALDANLSEMDRMIWPILYREPFDFLEAPLDSPYNLIQATQKFRNEMFLNYFRGRVNQIRSIYFVTPSSIILSSDDELHSFYEFDRDKYYAMIRSLQEKPLDIHWFTGTQAFVNPKDGYQSDLYPSVIAARRIMDSNRAELQGYLFIQFNNLFLDDVLRSIRIGKTGTLLLMDQNKEIVYKGQSQSLDNPQIKSAVDSISSMQSGARIVDNKWLLAIDTSAVSGWKMVAVVPLQELLEPNQKILHQMLILAVIGLIAAIFVSVYLANVISKPIVRLSQLMIRASYGNFNVRESKLDFIEVTLLQRNFNNMMEKIQQLIVQVEKEQQGKQEAQLKALQTQIHPHFLYNTLDTIYWMSKKYKADQISKLVTSLGRFFRLSLNATGEWTTVEKEFEHVRNYMEIQSVRYRDKVKYELILDAEVHHIQIMPLIMQPIVENAFEHGITQSSEKQEMGWIHIKGWREGNEVFISIEDNGKGMDQETLERVIAGLGESPSSEHIGLRNIQQRLLLAYGAKYGLQLSSQPHEGTLVLLRIPISGGGSYES
jgi:two-component system sensor histidine kinase YesM